MQQHYMERIRKVVLALLLFPIAACAQWEIGSRSFTVPSGSLPNFGNTIQEATQVNTQNAAFRLGGYFVAPATGTYTTIHAYCLGNGTTSQFVGLYNTSAGSANGQSLVAQGSITCPASAGWVTGSISAPVVLGHTYFFVESSSANIALFFYWMSTAGSGAFVIGTGSLPSTASGYTNQTGLYSMYLSAP
jgi:hypothetical protein